MVCSLRLLASLLLLALPTQLLARPTSQIQDVKTTLSIRQFPPLPPDSDPFYRPPAGFESSAPGTVLKSRRIVAAIFSIIPVPVEAHQILYRTTAIDGSAIATVTTIFVPLGPHHTDRFVSYHTAYDSSATVCQPSYGYQLGSVPISIIASVERLIIEAYLILGYIVAAPDYEGPDAAFPVGRLEAMGVLDGMRAVKNYGEQLGFTTADPMIVGSGYSGGAVATAWAAALQSNYAPELNIKGYTAGGIPANLTGTFVTIDNTVFTGFVPAAIVGLTAPSTWGAELNPVLEEIITADGRKALEMARETCAVQLLLSFLGESLLNSTKYQTLGPALLQQPKVAAVLQQNTLGAVAAERPVVPTFVFHATQDEIIPYSNASWAVDRWCDGGADVHFTTFEAGGHATTLALALPAQLKFVADAFAGTTGLNGCSRDSVLTNMLDPLALGANLEPVAVGLINALLRLGDMDANVMRDPSVLA